jgi:hypothetical protein
MKFEPVVISWVRMFENMVLRRIYGPKRREVGENCIMRSFITFTLLQV